jgi:hypothetical protein
MKPEQDTHPFLQTLSGFKYVILLNTRFIEPPVVNISLALRPREIFPPWYSICTRWNNIAPQSRGEGGGHLFSWNGIAETC